MNVLRIRPEDSLDVLKAIAAPRGYHVWGEGSQHLVIAKYLSSSSRGVTIQPLTGKRTTIKRKTLTPADEEWVSTQEIAKEQEKDAAK